MNTLIFDALHLANFLIIHIKLGGVVCYFLGLMKYHKASFFDIERYLISCESLLDMTKVIVHKIF